MTYLSRAGHFANYEEAIAEPTDFTMPEEAKENYAGGAIGEAVGGDVDTVTLNQVKSVTAKNRVGGFIGCAGPGDLAGGNGLTLNLLGLKQLAES